MDPCRFSRDDVLYRDFLSELATGKNTQDMPEAGDQHYLDRALCVIRRRKLRLRLGRSEKELIRC